MRKGDKLEQDFSLLFHQKCYPVLISSLLLRSHNAGQIDIAGLLKKENKWQLTLCELKSTTIPSLKQMHRLRRAQDYLSRVLEIGVKLEVKFCQKADP